MVFMKNKIKKRKSKKSKFFHIKFKDRIVIDALFSQGFKKKKIAERIGKSKNAVGYEILTNSVNKKYNAEKANFKAYQKRWIARRNVMKVATDKELRNYVETALQKFWSPEGISGRIKFVDTHIPYAGKDAIYKFVKRGCGKNLEEFLWYKGKKKKAENQKSKSDLKDRVFIEKRPKIVGKRGRYLDWEGDFIVSGKDGSGALLVLVERKSRYVLIFKLYDRKIKTINDILKLVFGSGQLLCQSLTIDNDICFKQHKQMSAIIGAPIFFCHPYHSWEKGSVEKVNQLIRRFVQKKSDISKISEEKIQWVQNILNNRPLKCLGFYTPAETLARSRKLKTFVKNSLKLYNLSFTQTVSQS